MAPSSARAGRGALARENALELIEKTFEENGQVPMFRSPEHASFEQRTLGVHVEDEATKRTAFALYPTSSATTCKSRRSRRPVDSSWTRGGSNP